MKIDFDLILTFIALLTMMIPYNWLVVSCFLEGDIIMGVFFIFGEVMVGGLGLVVGQGGSGV